MSVEPVATTPTLDPPSPLPGPTDEAVPAAAPTAVAAGAVHVHTRSCYWDFRVAAWVCA